MASALNATDDMGFLSGGGELAQLIAAFDWRSTPLGPPDRWPLALRTVVGTALRSPLPIVTLWGEAGVMIYNDAYAEFAGGRHPAALGAAVRDAWPEVADFNDHVVRTVLGRGEPLSFKDQQLILHRDGRPADAWLNLDYSPILDERGEPLGVMAIVIETTKKVVADRQLQAERTRLAASERQFQTFAQAMPNHVWTAPPDGMLDWFNDRVMEYGGRAASEIMGTGWSDLVHPDDRPGAAATWAAALAAGSTYETEFRIRRHDGEYRWHLARAVPILGNDGEITRWIGSNTDIHEQKLAEAQTVRDRDRLWELSQDLMLICDFAGLITSVNPSAQRMLGFDPSEMIGRTLAEFIHPDDVASTAAEVGKLSAGATTLAFQNRYRGKDGGYKLLDWTAVPEADRIHAIGRDITEERRLARDRERIWSLSPIVKVVAEQSGTIIAVNPSWTTLLGWPPEATVGRNILEFVYPSHRAAGESRLRQLGTTTAETVDSRSLFVGRDGSERHFAWTTIPEAGMLYLFGRDITTEIEAAEALSITEEALRQSQKMEAVGQLTGGIAHDFNNLLQGITGSLEIVQRRIAQGRTDDLDRFITGATGAAGRAAALTHRLLAFSRRQPLDPRTVEVNPLLASMADLLRRTIGERIELKIAPDHGLWLTRCDPNQLENAVLNLVINARDAMPDGGRLTVETCNTSFDDAAAARQRDVRPGRYICICVTDTGTGMSPETIAKAFEPFFTTKPLGQGTGLGLSMIYGFARQSEGFVRIYSEPGQGTTVKLYLPRFLGEAEEESEPRPAMPLAESDGETVLVVEDDAVVREMIMEVLAELGYRTLTSVDGPGGVEMLRSAGRIDLLITDIGLPGLNGRQVADAGRAIRPDLKVLFMTGYAENAAIASGFLERGMTMITKPFGIDTLAARIRAILESK